MTCFLGPKTGQKKSDEKSDEISYYRLTLLYNLLIVKWLDLNIVCFSTILIKFNLISFKNPYRKPYNFGVIKKKFNMAAD